MKLWAFVAWLFAGISAFALQRPTGEVLYYSLAFLGFAALFNFKRERVE